MGEDTPFDGEACNKINVEQLSLLNSKGKQAQLRLLALIEHKKGLRALAASTAHMQRAEAFMQESGATDDEDDDSGDPTPSAGPLSSQRPTAANDNRLAPE